VRLTIGVVGPSMVEALLIHSVIRVVLAVAVVDVLVFLSLIGIGGLRHNERDEADCKNLRSHIANILSFITHSRSVLLAAFETTSAMTCR